MGLVPVRMINEVVYCPRLFALEHIDGEWADSADTVRGRTVHKRVDTGGGQLPDPGADRPAVVRSLSLGDPGLGIVAKIDLVHADADEVVPVDYKKGRVPEVPEGAWPPERVQVCAQGLLLRAHGYRCDRGILYFAGSRRQVDVVFDDALVQQTLEAIAQARRLLEASELPPPLVDSPKCHGCSLVGICLPDETNLLAGRSERVRTVAPAHEDGLPLYVLERGAKLSLRKGEILVRPPEGEARRVRIVDTSRVVVSGAASVTTPLLAELGRREIPLSVHGWGWKLQGTFVGAGGHNVLGRIAQHRVAADEEEALGLARAMVVGKIGNQRVLLRRNGREVPDRALALLSEYVEQAGRAPTRDALYGTEGIAARTYFEQLPRMLKGPGLDFDFETRNRRPPRDPVNALLSFAYACLLRECTQALVGVGLDAWVGFLHRPRPGKPALALDLMEEFRPVIADSVVLTAINNGVVGPGDFRRHRVGTALRDAARRRVVRTFEQRLAHEIQHPLFGRAMSYRRILEVQARLIAKAVRGDIPEYPPFRVR
jgi:CRISPR-associated protein Cas1